MKQGSNLNLPTQDIAKLEAAVQAGLQRIRVTPSAVSRPYISEGAASFATYTAGLNDVEAVQYSTVVKSSLSTGKEQASLVEGACRVASPGGGCRYLRLV